MQRGREISTLRAGADTLFSFDLSCMMRIFPSWLFLCSLDEDIRKEEHCHCFSGSL